VRKVEKKAHPYTFITITNIMAPENDSNSTQNSPKTPSYNPSDRIPGGPITASGLFKCVDGKTIEIRDVWASNLEEEMGNIREILEKYPYVAMVSWSPYFSLKRS
jgi:hypothetical protein